MILNGVIIYKMLGVSMAAFSASFMLLGSVVHPSVSEGTAIAQAKWTVTDLRKMATNKKLKAVVSSLTSAADGSVAPVLQVKEIQKVISAATDRDIRNALLNVTDGKGGKKKSPVQAFARTLDAEALCGTSGSAGHDGLDVCVHHCERKPHFLARTPHKGACFMLCSLAVTPCSSGYFSFVTSSKNWGSPPQKSWATSVKDCAATQVKSMTPDYERMVTMVEAMASLVFFKGVEIVRYVAASSAMDVFSSWVFAAGDALQTPRGLKVMFLLFISYAYGKYTEFACRAAGAHIRRMKEHAKAAREEVMRLRLTQLFKVRGRLLKKKGLWTWKANDAWSIHHEAANADRTKEACRILGRLVSGRARRAMAIRFMRLKVAAAAMSAVIDAASSEGDAKDGKGKGAG